MLEAFYTTKDKPWLGNSMGYLFMKLYKDIGWNQTVDVQ